MALTDDEAMSLNRRVEATLGDDGTCFGADGTEREDRIRTAIERSFGPRPHNAAAGNSWTMYYWRSYPHNYIDRVKEYRADPRPFATDDALVMTLLRNILDAGFQLQLRIAEDGTHWSLINKPASPQDGECDTIAEAVCRAWLAVAEPRPPA